MFPHSRGILSLLLLLLCAAAGPMAAQPAIPVPEMVRIPAGSFQMGAEEGASWEKPVHHVELPAFWIAKRPDIMREFRAFRPKHEVAFKDPSGNEEEQPVADVSWDDAVAYCRWLSERTGDSFRLPTEAEWERAVRGGLDQKQYPWGDEPPVPEDKVDDLSFRPQAKPNAFGVIAARWNLWEWTADWYDPDYYRKSSTENPQGPESGQFHVLRGGGYRNDPNSVFNWNRGSARPQSATSVITFRVARDASAAPPKVTQQAPRPAPPLSSPAAAPTTAAGGPVRVTGIEVIRGSAQTAIQVATTGTAAFKTMRLAEPQRLVIDVSGTIDLANTDRTESVNHLGVLRIRSSQFSAEPPVVRIVVDMERAMEFSVDAEPSALEVQLRTAP